MLQQKVRWGEGRKPVACHLQFHLTFTTALTLFLKSLNFWLAGSCSSNKGRGVRAALLSRQVLLTIHGIATIEGDPLYAGHCLFAMHYSSFLIDPG